MCSDPQGLIVCGVTGQRAPAFVCGRAGHRGAIVGIWWAIETRPSVHLARQLEEPHGLSSLSLDFRTKPLISHSASSKMINIGPLHMVCGIL